MKKSVGLALGIFGVGLTVYGIYLFNQYLKLTKGSFNIKGAKDVNISDNKISFTLLTTLKNDGDISATVKDQHYDLFINGNAISTVDNKKEINILSNGTSVIPFYIEVNLNDLIKQGSANLSNIFLDKSKIKFELKGYFTWKAGLINSKQPFDLSYTLQEIIYLSKKKS